MTDILQYHPCNIMRYCPFCGAAGYAWDGAKAHQCHACGMRHYTNSAAAVAAIIEDASGSMLFVRRRYEPAMGMLDLPGGFVDLDETAEDALMREVREEVGLEVSAMRFWKTFANRYVYGGVLYFTTDLVYVCKVKDFSALHAADDAQSCLFLPKPQINIAHIGLMSIKNVVQQWLNQDNF